MSCGLWYLQRNYTKQKLFCLKKKKKINMNTESKKNCYNENIAPGVQCVPNFQAIPSTSEFSNIKNGSRVLNNSETTFTDNSSRQHLNSPFSQNYIDTSVQFVPILIDENVIQGAKEILKLIRPSWDVNYIEFKKFTDGITNKLVGCFYTAPIQNTETKKSDRLDLETFNKIVNAEKIYDDNNDLRNLSEAVPDTEEKSMMLNAKTRKVTEQTLSKNVVLVRVYGSKTDLLIDRKAEIRNILLLQQYGFAPCLYATFKNGLVYDYVPGVTLNPRSVLRPEIWPLVAQRMANMHRLVKPNWNRDDTTKPVPMLWKTTQKFFDLVPVQFTDVNKHKRLEGTFLPITRMRKEFANLYKRLETLGSPLVFAHNDLLLGNIIYTDSSKAVTFIDFEYADFNYQAFDIGNHFAEFAGVDTVDYTLYPTRDFQLKWLRVYLQTYLQKPQIDDAEVETLYVQVNQFALAAHFFWTIWCLIQSEHSTIDFDYVEYAFIRYNEYISKKETFLALDANLPKCKI